MFCSSKKEVNNNKEALHQFYTSLVYTSACEDSCIMSPDALLQWEMMIRIIYKCKSSNISSLVLNNKEYHENQTNMDASCQPNPFIQGDFKLYTWESFLSLLYKPWHNGGCSHTCTMGHFQNDPYQGQNVTISRPLLLCGSAIQNRWHTPVGYKNADFNRKCSNCNHTNQGTSANSAPLLIRKISSGGLMQPEILKGQI